MTAGSVQSALDYCDPCQQSESHVKWHDRLCGRGQLLLLRGNDTVEIRDDGAQNTKAPEVVFVRYRSWNAPHQQKPGNIGWRCPASGSTFGFIVEQLFTAQRGTAILPERRGEFAIGDVAELVPAQRACDAPAQQLASPWML